jgi:hypothetical protein
MPTIIRLEKGYLPHANGDGTDAFIKKSWFNWDIMSKHIAPGLVITEKAAPIMKKYGQNFCNRETVKVHGVVYAVGEDNDVGRHVKLWPLVKVQDMEETLGKSVLKQVCHEYCGIEIRNLDGKNPKDFYHNKRPCTFVLKDVEGKVKPLLTADQMRDPSSVPVTTVVSPVCRSVSPGPRVRFQDPGAGPSNRNRAEPVTPVVQPVAPTVQPVTPVVQQGVNRPAWVDALLDKADDSSARFGALADKVEDCLTTSAETRANTAKLAQHDADIAQLKADLLAEKAERLRESARLEAKFDTETARLDGRVDTVAAKVAEIDTTLQIIEDKVPEFETEVADLKIAVALIKNPGFLQYVVNKLGAIVTLIGTASVANPEVWTTVSRMFSDLQHTVHMQSGSCAMNALGA